MESGAHRASFSRIKVRKRTELGRQLTRRLSMVAKVPVAILQKSKDAGPINLEITAIAPDKSQLTLPVISPSSVSALVAPIVLKYRVCRPRLLLAGSRAEVDPAADVSLLHGEVLLIEDVARQYNVKGDTDRRYRNTEKLLHAEDDYREILSSAEELYARPLARHKFGYHEAIFQPLADLAIVSQELCKRIQLALDNWDGDLKSSELFPASFWSSYWDYLERYVEAQRILDALTSCEDPLLDVFRVRQAAARHSPSSLLFLPRRQRQWMLKI